MNDECVYGDVMKQRTMTTDEWEAVHRPHLVGTGARDFKRDPFVHPAGIWHWRVCPCGAQHLSEEL